MIYSNINPQNHELKSLKFGLRHFGLQPDEWALIKKNKETFFIKNQNDDDFFFIGRIDHVSKKWKEITLASI